MLPLAGQMLKLDPYRGGQHGPCLRMIYNSVKYSICYSGCDVMMCSLTLLWCAGLSRFSRVRLFVTEWTVVCQAPLSIGFPRQGLPFPAPGIFLTQGSNLGVLCSLILYQLSHQGSKSNNVLVMELISP